MLDQLQNWWQNTGQTWWQNTTEETRAAILDGGVVLAALLVGHFLGVRVARALRARNFDAALRLPGSWVPGLETDRGFTPTLVAGYLVRLTIWAGAVWWMARRHDRPEIASMLGLIMTRTWGLATVLVAALALGSLLARRVIDCLQALPAGSGAMPSRNGTGASVGGVAGAVGAVAYGLVVLLALLIAADMFDWPLTRSSAQALWQLAQHLFVAGAALFIGCLGARWARDLATSEGTASPEKRAGQYTAMGIVSATTLLAVAMLLASAELVLGLAALAVLGFLLWLARGYLPDVAAGLQLRGHKVRDTWLDGAQWQVAQVGLLTTELSKRGEFCRLQNRFVLESRMHAAPAAASPR
jgi:hypothetical protein